MRDTARVPVADPALVTLRVIIRLRPAAASVARGYTGADAILGVGRGAYDYRLCVIARD